MIKLIPVSIPWNLHPYLADFRISAREEEGLDITVNACFQANPSISTILGEEEIDRNREAGLLYTSEGYQNLSYQVLKISFERFLSFNMSHESKDFGILYSNGKYLVEHPLLESLSGKHPIEYREEVIKIINETGNNPDPLIFLVEDDSMTQHQKNLKLKKYFLCNKESNIEIIGSDLSWTSLGALYWE